ncbi:integrase [Paraburkholderia sp. GAS38]|uniref:tyrosine-type recombinase/integrase n=1 Tax=Paraburkholderia sp. GAS38 TaxID=3035133 RepID=UPI003D1DB7C0
MARGAENLNERLVQGLRLGDSPKSDGMVPGLIVKPTAKGATWTLRFTSPVTRRPRDMGLGTYPTVKLADARRKAQDARRLIDQGKDPIDERNREREGAEAAATGQHFEQAARKLYKELAPTWKGGEQGQHGKQWIRTLETYVFPKIGSRKLDTITPADCADVLRPIWLGNAVTASRVKQRMQAVMDWAMAHDDRIKANPVAVVNRLLAPQNHQPEHHPAMPWSDVPAFVKKHLVERDSNDMTRTALLFLILTAMRSEAVRGAKWQEFSPDFRVWTVPPVRMKRRRNLNKPHFVPLPDQAVALLTSLKQSQQSQQAQDALIFPSIKQRKNRKGETMVKDGTLSEFMLYMERRSDTPDRFATVHGFRSSFRDWARENDYSSDLAESAIAHEIGNETERAYLRTDLFNKRIPMMQAWADFLLPPEADNVK